MTKQRIVKIPQDIEPVDVSAPVVANAERLELGGAVYEEAGVCAQCGEKVYRWVSGAHNDAALGDALVVFVAFSHREPPGTYCQACDPNKQHRLNSPVLQPGKPAIAGDTWRPRA